jgi:hypothetical protein
MYLYMYMYMYMYMHKIEPLDNSMTKMLSDPIMVHVLIISFPVTGRSIDKKLQLANLASFALSPGKPPYKIAIYVPGTKVRLEA